ncbi:MAG: 50S ribosomal protein L25 [Cytophagales bacterium]|nr:50S ribosomal protein L25 [Cytophagales bacterium]
MKTVEIIGFKRANLSKSELNRLRMEGNIPCVIYGSGVNEAFTAPAIQFRDLVYTPEARFVTVNIEGKLYQAIKQDVQFHPVNDMLMHVDFLIIDDKSPIKLNIPVKLKGTASGVLKGGRMVQKLNHVKIFALPKDMPEKIELDVTDMEVGKSLRISDIPLKNFQILKTPAVPICTVEATRAVKEEATQAAAAVAATPSK